MAGLSQGLARAGDADPSVDIGGINGRWMMGEGVLRKLVAEFIGTFMLVFVGCGAIAVDATTGGVVGHVGVSLAFGLVVMVMIYATGHISGAHFNPAVTLAFAAVSRFSWRQVPGYILSQVGGALCAAGVLSVVFVEGGTLGSTAPSVALTATFIVEILLSFALMFVIIAVATDSRAEGQMAGLAIGGTVATAALFGGPLTGASMNPARSLGPALVASDLSDLWIYLTAPCVGTVAAALVYVWLQRCPPQASEDAGGCC